MTHDELKDALPAYALDALDAADRAAVAAHLPTCPACQAELVVLQRVADGIGLEAPPVTPPASLKARVLGAIPARATDSLDAWRQLPRAAQAPAPRRRSWLLPLAAAAAVALAAWALQYANSLRLENERLHQVQRVMAAPDVLRVELKAQTQAESAFARVFWSRGAGLVLVAERLPVLPAGRVYQLWTITGTAATSAGVLTPREDGTALHAASISPGAARPDAFGITIEPDGGSTAPTLPIVMLGAAGQ
jgi:anti-sigma-K factor RskA